MKRLLNIMLLAALVALGGCHRNKVIPENELGAIFHDAMLVNAYIGTKNINIDSLNIYEPIFEKYGYTTEDVRYTINNFSRRKNARLGDVAEYMIKQFDDETKVLKREVAILDTIDNVATRRFHTRLLSDTAIVAKSAADSVLLRYYIPIKGKGTYDIAAKYTADDDKVRGRRIVIYKMRRDSSKTLVYQTNLQLDRTSNLSSKQKIEERDSNYVALYIDFIDNKRVDKKERKKTTPITLHEIRVDYNPETEKCVKMRFDEQSNMRIFSDTMIRAIETLAAGPNLQTSRAKETAND